MKIMKIKKLGVFSQAIYNISPETGEFMNISVCLDGETPLVEWKEGCTAFNISKGDYPNGSSTTYIYNKEKCVAVNYNGLIIRR